MEANTSNDNAHNNSGAKDAKRQQFSNKQRMDMYAFCVLELEMHSNKVSIKKQQQAIQKVLYEQQKEGQRNHQQQDHHNNPSQQQTPPPLQPPPLQQPHQQQQQQQHQLLTPPPSITTTPQATLTTLQASHQLQQQPPQQPLLNGESTSQQQQQHQLSQSQPPPPQQQAPNQAPQSNVNNCNQATSGGVEGKTLLQLQQEVAMTRKCYSDYQKTQVLTSSMLRDVQKRFAKYYPDSAIPSRSTIKHVFEKCVAHGTVENIRTPRKATKIPQGDEIEYLLIHEPQLSLRQLAQKLNVSTGTVSRRCKALGLVPESVTIKHQQLATARRQKQIKQLESQSKATAAATTSNGNHHDSKMDVAHFD